MRDAYTGPDARAAEVAVTDWIDYIESCKPDPGAGFYPAERLRQPYFQLYLPEQHAGRTNVAEGFLTQAFECTRSFHRAIGYTNEVTRADLIAKPCQHGFNHE